MRRGSFRDAPALPLATIGGFASALIALILIAGLSYRSLVERAASAQRTEHSIAVLEQVAAVLSTLKDAETGQRGYVLTGDERYLQPYAEARGVISRELAELRRLIADDPERQHASDELEQVATEKMVELANTIALRRAGKTAEALTIVRADTGKTAMDRARLIAGQLRVEEQEILTAHNRESQSAVARSTAITWGGSGVLLLLFLGAAYLTSRDFRTRAREAWIRAGQGALAAAMQGDRRLESLGDSLLPVLARTLDAQVGALYFAAPDGRYQRFAGYGLVRGAGDDAPVMRPGDGLCGQAAKENRVIEVHDVPHDYLTITSALGRARPRHLVITPASLDGKVQAVLELGFLHPPPPLQRELLRRGAEAIAMAVRSAQDRTQLEALLEETQRQAEELHAQQEELRHSNDTLEAQGRMLRESQAQLENQQIELEQSNLSLEEQAHSLEAQRDEQLLVERQITEKAAELERVNQYKSEFLANMSHELRTPLNSALIMSGLLAENRTGNLTAEQVQFAETIVSSGNDLLTLINDVLDLAKIESGKAEVNPEAVDVVSLFDNLVAMFDPLARQKGIALTVVIDPGAPRVIETDAQRLQQILRNLVANAFKFTEAGQVSLAVRATAGDTLGFAVRDTGIGIPPAQHDVIFEAFRQADGTTHRRYGGTGLGLSISRDLARLLGGDVRVESAVGVGSTFTVTLPRIYRPVERTAAGGASHGPSPSLLPPGGPGVPTATPGAPTPMLAPGAPRADGGGLPRLAELRAARLPVDDDRDVLRPGARVILVIEDDPVFARIVVDLVRELQFQCLVTSSADEGVEMAKKYLPSAVVLDVTLPDQSGLTVLDRLKRMPATRHIPVHVVSASDYSRTALTLGAVGYMLKPIKREELADALRRLEVKLAQKLQRILIVDADATQRDSVARLLVADQVETIAVATVAEARAQLRAVTFDCVVMDLALPDATGLDLLEHMMEDEDCAVPPVIVHTARSLTPDEEQRLRRYSRSIIIKGARSPERLLDEVTLFLHQVESSLPSDRQRLLKQARNREDIFEHRRLLVVEDDVRNVFALSSVFEPRGARVEIARNGREALERLSEAADRGRPFDLVLMDIMMPEMDGLTAMREIRKRPEWKGLPIIALTAKAMADDHEVCLAAGANDYLAKPLDLEKLLSLSRIWMAK